MLRVQIQESIQSHKTNYSICYVDVNQVSIKSHDTKLQCTNNKVIQQLCIS